MYKWIFMNQFCKVVISVLIIHDLMSKCLNKPSMYILNTILIRFFRCQLCVKENRQESVGSWIEWRAEDPHTHGITANQKPGEFCIFKLLLITLTKPSMDLFPNTSPILNHISHLFAMDLLLVNLFSTVQQMETPVIRPPCSFKVKHPTLWNDLP